MLKGFKDFVLRGNVVDLAVAVVVGAAFTLVVNALVEGIINPLIAALFGRPDLSRVGTFTVNDAEFSLGLVLDAVVNLLLVAAAIYFLVVTPVNRLMAMRKRGDEPEVASPSEDIVLLQQIRDLLAERRGAP
ncbi:MAG: large conductance mechanosensitive channel protein MscL [Actinomycetota bacterium]